MNLNFRLATITPTGKNYTDWQQLHQLATITPTGNNFTDWQHFHRLATISPTGNNFTDIIFKRHVINVT
jgi:hypothetical protein